VLIVTSQMLNRGWGAAQLDRCTCRRAAVTLPGHDAMVVVVTVVLVVAAILVVGYLVLGAEPPRTHAY